MASHAMSVREERRDYDTDRWPANNGRGKGYYFQGVGDLSRRPPNQALALPLLLF